MRRTQKRTLDLTNGHARLTSPSSPIADGDDDDDGPPGVAEVSDDDDDAAIDDRDDSDENRDLDDTADTNLSYLARMDKEWTRLMKDVDDEEVHTVPEYMQYHGTSSSGTPVVDAGHEDRTRLSRRCAASITACSDSRSSVGRSTP